MGLFHFYISLPSLYLFPVLNDFVVFMALGRVFLPFVYPKVSIWDAFRRPFASLFAVFLRSSDFLKIDNEIRLVLDMSCD